MGDEILTSQFDDQDYQNYRQRLEKETAHLKTIFEENEFDEDQAYGGLEQEAWLVDEQTRPSSDNEILLNRLPPDVIAPELAKFNFELNVTPQLLHGDGIHRLHTELLETWKKCEAITAEQNDKIIMVGILPTVEDKDLVLENMSPLNRYRALNEQVMLARKGLPLNLDIVGREHLVSQHSDVMLESAATSFQIHRQIPAKQSRRYYNAAIIASAATVAAGVNSPFFMGKSLWEETRIPLFETSVEIGGYGEASRGPIKRVGFGSGYAKKNVFECFEENLEHFPILLPVTLDEDFERLPYLRLHNGTIWRWNRPLIGFDKQNRAHLRIEHRVIAAGPTIADEMANTAFFFGLQEYLANLEAAPEDILEFSTARDNFYEAARLGVKAKNQWLDGKKSVLRQLILDQLIDAAHEGLERLQVDREIVQYYLNIIEQRVLSGQTGSQWQREFVDKYKYDMSALTEAYMERQETQKPVHEWKL